MRFMCHSCLILLGFQLLMLKTYRYHGHDKSMPRLVLLQNARHEGRVIDEPMLKKIISLDKIYLFIDPPVESRK